MVGRGYVGLRKRSVGVINPQRITKSTKNAPKTFVHTMPRKTRRAAKSSYTHDDSEESEYSVVRSSPIRKAKARATKQAEITWTCFTKDQLPELNNLLQERTAAYAPVPIGRGEKPPYSKGHNYLCETKECAQSYESLVKCTNSEYHQQLLHEIRLFSNRDSAERSRKAKEEAARAAVSMVEKLRRDIGDMLHHNRAMASWIKFRIPRHTQKKKVCTRKARRPQILTYEYLNDHNHTSSYGPAAPITPMSFEAALDPANAGILSPPGSDDSESQNGFKCDQTTIRTTEEEENILRFHAVDLHTHGYIEYSPAQDEDRSSRMSADDNCTNAMDRMNLDDIDEGPASKVEQFIEYYGDEPMITSFIEAYQYDPELDYPDLSPVANENERLASLTL